MSHDPTHFDEVVKTQTNVQSYAFWSYSRNAIWFRFEKHQMVACKIQIQKWADLYESEGKYLYVNRGFGVIAYPGRVGINPEITVIELV